MGPRSPACERWWNAGAQAASVMRQLPWHRGATVASLAAYRGDDEQRYQRLLAEAYGRGVARDVLTPHRDTVLFMRGDTRGAIISYATDSTVRVTEGTHTSTIASDALFAYFHGYSAESARLAYPTTPTGLNVLDLETRTITRIDAPIPARLALAPDGSKVAALDTHGVLRVWSLSPVRIIHEESAPNALSMMFADATHLIAREKTSLRAIQIEAGRSKSITAALSSTTFEALHGDVVIGDETGRITLLSTALKRIASASVCPGEVNNVRLAQRARVATFACQDGTFGVAKYDDTHNMTVDAVSTRWPSYTAEPDPTGERIVVWTESPDVYLYDVTTRLLTRYEGQGAGISMVTAPTPEFDRVLVGDVNGGIRVYDPPSRDARVVLKTQRAVFGVAFSPDGKTIVTESNDPVIRRVSLADGGVTELPGHRQFVLRVRFSPDGTSFLSFSPDGTVRVWSPSSRHPDGSPRSGSVGDRKRSGIFLV
jgi:WD40 repeat protein